MALQRAQPNAPIAAAGTAANVARKIRRGRWSQRARIEAGITATEHGGRDSYRHGDVEEKWKPILASYRARCLIDARDEAGESFEDRQHRLVTAVEALKNLEEDDRELLDDHYIHQLSYAEMGRRRGRSEGAVAKATNRAVHALRQWLAKHCH